MIPKSVYDADQVFVVAEKPTNTYRLDIANNRIIGFTDKLDAMRQAIYLILNIERYEHLIYSWNYGTELADLFGQQVPLVFSEIERRIREALLQDSRIKGVENFSFERSKGKVHAAFTVRTIFGEIQADKVVNL